MAEGEGPDPPRPPVPRVPGQPLPRLWKAEPEPDDADKPPRDRRSRLAAEKEEREAKSESANPKAKSKKTSDRNTSKGTARPKGKGVLIEETPELDTYETRQRARLLFGGLIAAVGLIAIVVVYNSLQGPTFDDEGVVDEGGPPGASPVASGPKPPQVDPKIEQEAKNLLSTARQLAKNGKTQEATVILQRVTKSYPKTAASALAKAAIARPTQNLPLFLDEEMVVASPVSPAKPGAPNVMNVVDASVAPAPSGEPGNATLQLNPNPALTPRAPGAPTQPRAEVAAKPLPGGNESVQA
jgi:sulfatase modifying factor 1